MVELTEMRQDVLAELFNIGVGQAAAALSEVVSDVIELSAPEISICSVTEARSQLLDGESRKVSAVVQQFSGPFNTQAMLVFPETHALEIVRLMINAADLTPEEISEYEQEAMCEVGNIILNACMCALADSFCATIDGGLPIHRFDVSDALLKEAGESEPDKVILFLKVSILIRKHAVHGQIIFLMSIESLDALFGLVDQYLKRQGLE